MNLRDLRVKRSTEVLSGIKVIKLFSLEKVQLARLVNARNKELHNIFRLSLTMTVFNIIATCAAPLMSTIAFIAMISTGQFDISTAFTTVYLFGSLSFSFIMLPMMMSFSSDAAISSARITTFLQLPEQDPGVIVKI